jgi:potassium efflux system protein
LLLGLAWASLWPVYLVLVAQAARLAPWPRNLAILASTVLHGLAIGAFLPSILSWLTRRDGWAERFLGVPTPVCRQVCRAGRFLAAAAVFCIVPTYLLSSGEFAPDGRPITAPALCRFLVLGFEVAVWAILFSILRGGSELMRWCDFERVAGSVEASGAAQETRPHGGTSISVSAVCDSSTLPSPWLCWISRRRRALGWLLLFLAGAIIVLDVRGFSFTARRLAVGGTETLALCIVCWSLNRGLNRIISQYARRWVQPGRSWARAITTAVSLRAASRNRGAEPGVGLPDASDDGAGADRPEELAMRLRQLAFYLTVALGGLWFAFVWELDPALIRFLANRPLWYVAETPVTVGELTRALAVVLVGGLAWRYMSTLFAVTLFPRIPDDPGLRFAIVTLCRYVALGVTIIVALGAIHVGTAQIGMVLAALGVGLGFGLQEIVSNFVCGIILLLERPIRIGDVVTVAGTSGKVDRINIRATTIINGDNQSMIVPNREFITGNLVNWTHKDRILRITIRVGAAYGSVPEEIVDLLLAIAGADPEVLPNPLPSAFLEELGDSALKFVLCAYVPDPGLVGGVKHRLCSAVQRRFAESRIAIPNPTYEVHLCRVPEDLTRVLGQPQWLTAPGSHRLDAASAAPPPPHLADPAVPVARFPSAVNANEGVHRAVDE